MARTRSVGAAVRRVSETKYHSASNTDLSIGATGTFLNLTAIGVGGGVNLRIGNRIWISGIKVRCVFACASSDENNLIRMIFVRGKAGAIDPGDMPTNLVDPIDRDKFTTLRDMTVASHLANATAGVVKQTRNFYIKVNRYCQFDATTTLDNLTGAIGMWVLSDSGAIPNPTISYNIQVFYKDI